MANTHAEQQKKPTAQRQSPRQPRTPASVGPQRGPIDTRGLIQRALADPSSLTRAEGEHLQRSIGNRAVGQILAASAVAKRGADPAAPVVQAKLTLGPAGDKYEQEADRTAKQVMRSLDAPVVQREVSDGATAQAAPPIDSLAALERNGMMRVAREYSAALAQRRRSGEGALQAKPLANGISRIQREEMEEDELQMKRQADDVSRIQRAKMEEEDELQAKPLHGLEGGEVDPGVAATIGSAKGGGQPLHDGVRASMERGFGADFSDVRVHTGWRADTLNRSLNARAFTSGSDLFFRQGEYNPGSRAGQELIAHELTHTVQQGAAGVQRDVEQVQREFEPSTNEWWNEIVSIQLMSGGLSNKGLMELKNGANKSIVIKFTDEDPRRAAYADVVLGSAGVSNASAQAIETGSLIGKTIAEKIKLVGAEWENSKDINNAVERGQTAKYISIMKKVGGTDFSKFDDLEQYEKLGKTGKVKDEQGPNGETIQVPLTDIYNREKDIAEQTSGWNDETTLDFVTSSNFIEGLGRMYAADAVLGNQDRISQDVTKEGEGITFNAANFKVLRDSVGAIDNDTELFSQALVAKTSGVVDPDRWVELLIQGSNDSHIDQNSRTERSTQSLESLFREDIFPHVYRMLGLYLRKHLQAPFQDRLSLESFVTHFKSGIKKGLQGILANSNRLIEQAGQVGGEDKGGGFIDPEAVKLKLAYLGLRTSETEKWTPEQALTYAKLLNGSEDRLPTKTRRVISFGEENGVLTKEEALKIKTLLQAVPEKEQAKMLHILSGRVKKGGSLKTRFTLGKVKKEKRNTEAEQVRLRLEAARAVNLKRFALQATQSGDIEEATIQAIGRAERLAKKPYMGTINPSIEEAALARHELMNLGVDVNRWGPTLN